MFSVDITNNPISTKLNFVSLYYIYCTPNTKIHGSSTNSSLQRYWAPTMYQQPFYLQANSKHNYTF